MATLTLTFGTLTESVTLDDAAATVLLTDYLRTVDPAALERAPRQQVRAVVRSLGGYIRQQARRQVELRRDQEREAAIANDLATLGDWA